MCIEIICAGSKPLANGDIAGVAYNRDNVTHQITMDFGVLNGSWAGASVSMYDLWQHETIGTFTGSYVATVPGHGVVAARLTRA